MLIGQKLHLFLKDKSSYSRLSETEKSIYCSIIKTFVFILYFISYIIIYNLQYKIKANSADINKCFVQGVWLRHLLCSKAILYRFPSRAPTTTAFSLVSIGPLPFIVYRTHSTGIPVFYPIENNAVNSVWRLCTFLYKLIQLFYFNCVIHVFSDI